MESSPVCPVCTLYLRPGITLKSHLATHPKQKVIEALVKLTEVESQPGDNNTSQELCQTTHDQDQPFNSITNTPWTGGNVQGSSQVQPPFQGNHVFIYQQSMSTSQTNTINPLAQQYIIPAVLNPQTMPYVYQQQQVIMSSGSCLPPMRISPFDLNGAPTSADDAPTSVIQSPQIVREGENQTDQVINNVELENSEVPIKDDEMEEEEEGPCSSKDSGVDSKMQEDNSSFAESKFDESVEVVEDNWDVGVSEDLNKACQTASAPQTNDEFNSKKDDCYYYADNEAEIGYETNIVMDTGFEQQAPIYTSANILQATEDLDFEVDGVPVIIGEFANSTVISQVDNFENMNEGNVLMTIGENGLETSVAVGLDIIEESMSRGSTQVNIQADERMPPRGELSGQESLGGASDINWNRLHYNEAENSNSILTHVTFESTNPHSQMEIETINPITKNNDFNQELINGLFELRNPHSEIEIKTTSKNNDFNQELINEIFQLRNPHSEIESVTINPISNDFNQEVINEFFESTNPQTINPISKNFDHQEAVNEFFVLAVSSSASYDPLGRDAWEDSDVDCPPAQEEDNDVPSVIGYTPPILNFKCSSCEEAFSCLQERKKHIQEKHPQQQEDKPQQQQQSQLQSSTNAIGSLIGKKKVKKLTIKPKSEAEPKYDTVFTNKIKMEECKSEMEEVKTDEGDARAVCDLCNTVLLDQKALKEHRAKVHKIPDRGRLKCSTCDELFPNEYKFTEHLKLHPLECKLCGKLFYRRQNIQLHMKRHLGIKPHKCEVCEKAFLTKQKLDEHRNVHTGHAPIKCNLCNETFRRHSNLIQHRNRHHLKHKRKMKDYVCQCGEYFHSRKKLAWHKETHDTKPKACTKCNEKFVHMSSLTRHMRKAHNERFLPSEKRSNENVDCPVCKAVVVKSSLDIHMRTHTGAKPYSCLICNKDFTTRWNLKLHKWTHASRVSKPFKCDQCNGAFVRESDYTAHMNSHKSIKPYTCNYCGARFIRKYNCQRHVKEHENQKTYSCTVCGKLFHRSYYLKDHMRVHSGVRPYTCHICGKTSTTKSNHNKHVQIHHPRSPVTTEA